MGVFLRKMSMAWGLAEGAQMVWDVAGDSIFVRDSIYGTGIEGDTNAKGGKIPCRETCTSTHVQLLCQPFSCGAGRQQTSVK